MPTLNNAFLSAFSLELSMLMHAGITVSDGLYMLQDDEPTREGKEVLANLIAALDKGVSLSRALRDSGYFPRYMVEMVAIGERTGRAVETLNALSAHYERQDRLANSIKNALLYPSILLIMMTAVVIILLVRVLPIFNEVFNRLGTQMSPLATNLMELGAWLRGASTGFAILGGLIIIVALLALLVPALRGSITIWANRTFGHRGVFGDMAMTRFISAMVLSLASGLDTQEAVEMAAVLSGGSRVIDANNQTCLELLRQGNTLADAMQQAGLLTARNGRMLSLGSRSGMTDTAMAEIASRSEKALQIEIDSLVGKIEPTLVIITSVIIGVILLSVMLPLMSIMTTLG
ncbi:MAG: type II secretion system F family protein [Symbiobacteriaceae bacterium]|nr:type II secretion system F family protein [Symbiobacteriaceae bacterium]